MCGPSIDQGILRDVQAYDKDLFIKWNNKKHFFELWRKRVVGSDRITPITRSIYDPDLPDEFVELDQRLLWWIYEADSWKHGGPKEHAHKRDRRFLEIQEKMDRARFQDFKDRAKEMWNLVNNRYVTKYASTNRGASGLYPKFGKKTKSTWQKPDVQSNFNKRLFSRSKENAKAFNWTG